MTSLDSATWTCSPERLSPTSVLYQHDDLPLFDSGKYSHAAVWPLVPASDKEGGEKSYPIAAMVANLAKPTPTKPALMRQVAILCNLWLPTVR